MAKCLFIIEASNNTEQDLDLQGARTGGLSNKIFVHLNYTAWQCYPWTPYVGLGGEIEFGKNLLKTVALNVLCRNGHFG